ncbi:hypothetical protein Ancab_028896 [Ancistrocladus abbreviatus]
MDPKAMAKSKRIHTKHHQPKKPVHPKTPSTSSSSASSSVNDPKLVKKEARERERPTQTSLPSNWDRYDETIEDEEEERQQELPNSDSEEPTRLSTNKTEVVKPKSKGADFGYLISQAKSELQSKVSASFDDVLPDVYQGFGSMLAAKGEKIVSWTGADNFLDDEATAVHEAPFLSLNLQALAEQLARVDLAKRLFIEADLLSPVLQGQETEAGNIETLRSQENETAARTSTELSPQSTVGTETMEDQSGQSNHVAEEKERPCRFEAAAAEAELDMLLDSLGEAKLFDSSIASEVGSSFNKEEQTFASTFRGKSSIYVAPSGTAADQDLSGSEFCAASINDAIDDLLDKTSDLMNKDDVFPPDVNSILIGSSSSSSSHPGPKSKVLEDFDSWFDTL